MKTSVFVLALLFICSCSNVENLNENDLPFIRLYAEVGFEPNSKTVTEEDGTSYFVKNDCIGLFTPGNNKAGMWKFDGTNWNTDTGISWDNKEDRFDFCAFYPCTDKTSSRDGILMPNLSVQSGKLSEIGKKDFLVARCTASYNDNEGLVSFSGSNSFRHIYSLLHLEIVSMENNEEVLVKGCEFTGDNIVQNHKYIFGNSKEDDRTVVSETSEDSILKIEYNTPVSIKNKHEIAVLLNPVSLNNPLEFSLYYEKKGVSYVAKIGLLKEIKQGTYSKIRLKWIKDALTISGNEITDWNVSQLDDILFQGSYQ